VTILRPQPMGVPAPVPSLFSAPYWDGCAVGELRFARCHHCGQAVADAPRICWRCHHRELRWEVSAGRGRLYSWTIVWRPQTPEFEVPYAVAVVTLDEGVEVVSSVVGCEPGDLVEGMALDVEFHPISETLMLPYFRPVGPALLG
jgi:uncharacterized OB-fold protein